MLLLLLAAAVVCLLFAEPVAARSKGGAKRRKRKAKKAKRRKAKKPKPRLTEEEKEEAHNAKLGVPKNLRKAMPMLKCTACERMMEKHKKTLSRMLSKSARWDNKTLKPVLLYLHRLVGLQCSHLSDRSSAYLYHALPSPSISRRFRVRKAVKESCLAAKPDLGPDGRPMGGGGGGDDPVAQACAFFMAESYERIIRVFRRRLDPKYEEYEEDIVPEDVCSHRELAACKPKMKGIDRSINDPEKRFKERQKQEREDEEKARKERREARKKKKKASKKKKAAAAAAKQDEL